MQKHEKHRSGAITMPCTSMPTIDCQVSHFHDFIAAAVASMRNVPV